MSTTEDTDAALDRAMVTSLSMKRLLETGVGLDGGAIYGPADSLARDLSGYPRRSVAGTADEAGPAVTASDMLKEIEKTKAEILGMTGAGAGDPTGWKMTSVRWLKENHPEYVRAGKNADNVLTKALAAMSYCEAEAMRRDGAHDPRAAAEMRAQLLDSWDSDRHQNMRDFLLHGGLASRKVALGKDLKDPPGYQYQERSPRKTATAAVAVEQNLDEVVRELGNPTTGSW